MKIGERVSVEPKYLGDCEPIFGEVKEVYEDHLIILDEEIDEKMYIEFSDNKVELLK